VSLRRSGPAGTARSVQRGVAKLECEPAVRGLLADRIDEFALPMSRDVLLPLHLQPAFAGIRRSGRLDQAERLANDVLCLPIYPGLTETNQRRVIDAVRSYVGAAQA
jgi:dTDP-4-amino-4,6-dideoxygalactose transaminase